MSDYLQAGYRHVDTAAQYGVEKEVHIKRNHMFLY